MITAVVTNYNKPPDILKRCIDSIMAQGLEYILVDDNSDETSHLSSYENVIKLQKNVGAYKAFDEGLKLVNTEYVIRIDGDDFLTGLPYVCGGYDAYISNIDGRATVDPDKFIDRPYALISGAIIKTKAMRDVWGTGLRFYGDILNYARLINRYNCKIVDSFYVYDKTHSMITKMDYRTRMVWIAKAKKLAYEEINKKELQWQKAM